MVRLGIQVSRQEFDSKFLLQGTKPEKSCTPPWFFVDYLVYKTFNYLAIVFSVKWTFRSRLKTRKTPHKIDFMSWHRNCRLRMKNGVSKRNHSLSTVVRQGCPWRMTSPQNYLQSNNSSKERESVEDCLSRFSSKHSNRVQTQSKHPQTICKAITVVRQGSPINNRYGRFEYQT